MAIKVHMADGNLAFDNAFRNAIGDHPRFVRCSWHTERAWKQNIKIHWMLETLKRLRTEWSEINFNNMIRLYLDTWLNPQELAAQLRYAPQEIQSAVTAAEYFDGTWGLQGR